MSDTTFESGDVDADAHEWGEDDSCILCGAAEPDQNGTAGPGQSGTTDAGKNGVAGGSGGNANQPGKGGSSLARTGNPLAGAAPLCVAAAVGALGIIASLAWRGSRR